MTTTYPKSNDPGWTPTCGDKKHVQRWRIWSIVQSVPVQTSGTNLPQPNHCDLPRGHVIGNPSWLPKGSRADLATTYNGVKITKPLASQQPLERQRKRGSEVFIRFPHPTHLDEVSTGFLRNSIYNSAKGGIMVQHATINNASLPKDNSNNKSRSLHELRLHHSISNKAQAVHTRHKPGNGFQRSSDSTVLTTPNHTTGRQFLQEKVVQLHKTVRWYQRWTHRGGIVSRYDFRRLSS